MVVAVVAMMIIAEELHMSCPAVTGATVCRLFYDQHDEVLAVIIGMNNFASHAYLP